MRFLGIDPGIERTGFAVIEKQKNKLHLLDCGLIFTHKRYSLPERLSMLADDLRSVIEQWHPTCAGVEKLFFSKNVKTALTVAHARGVILQELGREHLEVVEFSPGEVKLSVCGESRADKKQMQKMVEYQLGIRRKNDDTIDAVACAICLATTYGFTSKTKRV